MSSSSSGFSSLMPRCSSSSLHRRARRGDEPELGVGDDVGRLRLVVLVLDIADDLLDQVLDGDEAVGAAVLVDHQRHVDVRRLHADQQVRRRHRRRHVDHRPAQLGRGDRLATDRRGRDRARPRSAGRERSPVAGAARAAPTARGPRWPGGPAPRRSASATVLDVDHAARIIERLAKQRHARDAGGIEGLQQLARSARSRRRR